jgi:alkylation response protein AidB-like acyl-CoA dehydrogenase
VVDGSKSFITNSGTAITSLVTVLAITGRGEDGRKEISSIIVPNGTAGFVPGPEYSKVGWCASDTHELSFTGCRVPGGEPARRAGPRLRPVPADPDRGPGSDRGAGHRAGAGLRG